MYWKIQTDENTNFSPENYLPKRQIHQALATAKLTEMRINGKITVAYLRSGSSSTVSRSNLQKLC